MKTAAILGLAVALGLLPHAPEAADLPAPEIGRLDDATVSALDAACTSWVMRERQAQLQPWLGAIGPLCEAAGNRPPKPLSQPVASTPSTPAAGSLGDKLQQLKALLDSGLITQEDYDKTKTQLLSGFAN